jgi:hypothetical protein
MLPNEASARVSWDVRTRRFAMSESTFTKLAVAGALFAAGCGTDGTAPADSGTPSATAVLSVVPAGGTTSVDPNGPFSITFDGAMMPGMERYVDLHRGDVTGPVHPMSCAWSADYTTLTCTPAQPLDPTTWYTFHLGGGVQGSNGTPVAMDPGTCAGAWAEPGPRNGHGPDEGHMMGETHGGEPWSMMDPGWHHANGSYGMVITFQTA